MPEPVTIPIAIVDVTMEYVRPNMRLLIDRINVVDRLFEVYSRWGVKVDDVEVITEGKPSEQGVKFKIPKQRTSFFFSPAHCRLTRDDADWGSAEETMEILRAGLGALAEIAGVQIGCFKTSISLHLQPKTAPFVQLLRPFAAHRLVALDPSEITAFATVVKWNMRRITIDGSAQLANGIFLRFEREFPGSSTIDDIATQLRADENELFGILGVEEAQS